MKPIEIRHLFYKERLTQKQVLLFRSETQRLFSLKERDTAFAIIDDAGNVCSYMNIDGFEKKLLVRLERNEHWTALPFTDFNGHINTTGVIYPPGKEPKGPDDY